VHLLLQRSFKKDRRGRVKIARFFNCEKRIEIYIFTSGATHESNNWVIKGVVKASKEKNPHIITSSIEHHCILEACREVSAEVTYIKPDKNGIVSSKDIEKAIKKNTILISIMYVNNEIGTVSFSRLKKYQKIKERHCSIQMPLKQLNLLTATLKQRLGVRLYYLCLCITIYGTKGGWVALY
jgi:cysteine sulfinate desulfinase/cysteine desulfurase-like protein